MNTKKPSKIFPAVIWEADYDTMHIPLYLMDFYLGNENYALYTSKDGIFSKRLYISFLDNFGRTKKEALEKLQIKLERRLEIVKEYIKNEQD